MKHVHLPFILFFILLNTNSFSQYLETFSIPNKGILAGTCNFTQGSCTSDFTGVSWTINGNFTGMDNDDFVSTNGSGVLFFSGDIDEELCFESPLLDISSVSGTASISVLVAWNHHDNAEYVDVEYQINEGIWTTIPIQFGDNSGTGHTIDFSGSGNTGSGTVTQGGINGNTLSVRVCVDSNTASSGESHTIDNVSVPEANVTILPVELISFKAEKRNKEVMLKWSTATELNNEKFEIEHGTNKKDFEKIGEVKGNATTLQVSNYSFNHNRPNTGINYYRLKQIDLDGKFEYSNVVSINIETNKTFVDNFYPNPSENGIVFLDYFSQRKSDLDMSIFDTDGKNIFAQKIELEKGGNKLDFDFSILEKGIYFVRLENSGNQEYRKLIIN